MKRNIARLMFCCLLLPVACHARDTYKLKLFGLVASQTLEGNYGRVLINQEIQ